MLQLYYIYITFLLKVLTFKYKNIKYSKKHDNATSFYILEKNKINSSVFFRKEQIIKERVKKGVQNGEMFRFIY